MADVENRPPTACNFVLATQPESSSEEDEATPGYFTQDSEDENEFHPLGKTSEDIARALEEGNKVKLFFFDEDPYPEDCKYFGMVPPGAGFPFGRKSPAGLSLSSLTVITPGHVCSTGLQTGPVKMRSMGTQTSLPPTPTDGRPVRNRCPPSELKEYDCKAY